MTETFEVNFDGLVGPTHNYAGLSFGNVASETHKGLASRPRAAALQGLAKMKYLHDMGLKQGILPPLKRPHLSLLRALGYHGTDEQILNGCTKHSPHLLGHIYSASSMWTANAATVSASADTQDGKVHFTAANLVSNLHRSLEAEETSRLLKAIFRDPAYFTHHPPLPAQAALGDEGAANYMRFCTSHTAEGVEVLVFGTGTQKYPARQTKLASESVLRKHGVKQSLVLEQTPAIIDKGVFHNDVIAVANENVLLYHEKAFTQGEKAIDRIEDAFANPLIRVRVRNSDVTVEDAVSSYLFNSQLVTLPTKKMAIIAPQESKENAQVYATLMQIQDDTQNPIEEVHFMDLRESMQNGGGPACLRLRVVLTENELQSVHQGVIITDTLYQRLGDCINKHYREILTPNDLADPTLREESFAAYTELMNILELPPIS